MSEATTLLEVRDVSKRFFAKRSLLARLKRAPARSVKALEQISFGVKPGEVVGLVGESGCGKSTLGRVIGGILMPSSGSLLWRGQPLAISRSRRKTADHLKVQLVFQDPFSSLNPRMRIGTSLVEAPIQHGLVAKRERKDYTQQLLEKVGLDPSMANRYPHEMSGGQRQRVGIARALSHNPEFIVADESVSALDVSIQAQILNLFLDLRAEMNLSILFISHDLGVVRYVSDRIGVMYLGRLVELANGDELTARPYHPYTKALLDQVPKPSDRKRAYNPIRGEIPSPFSPPSGCPFHTRCPHATTVCKVEVPILREVESGHFSACHLN